MEQHKETSRDSPAKSEKLAIRFKVLNFPEVTHWLPAKVTLHPQNRSSKATLELPGS